jgi:glutaredoxin
MRIEIYSKPDCPLCEEAKEIILQVQRRIPFELREVNIEGDRTLFEKFQYDIPVIFIDGRKAFKHRLGADELESRIRRALGTSVAPMGDEVGNKVPKG